MQGNVLIRCGSILTSNEMGALRMAVITRLDFLTQQVLISKGKSGHTEWLRIAREFNAAFPEYKINAE